MEEGQNEEVGGREIEKGNSGGRWKTRQQMRCFLSAALRERGKMKYFERNLTDLFTQP